MALGEHNRAAEARRACKCRSVFRAAGPGDAQYILAGTTRSTARFWIQTGPLASAAAFTVSGFISDFGPRPTVEAPNKRWRCLFGAKRRNSMVGPRRAGGAPWKERRPALKSIVCWHMKENRRERRCCQVSHLT